MSTLKLDGYGTYGRKIRAGLNYNAWIGIKQEFKTPFFIEAGIGYYSYKHQVAASSLPFFFSDKDASFRSQYLQGVLRLRFTLKTADENTSIAPILGGKMLALFDAPGIAIGPVAVDVTRFNGSIHPEKAEYVYGSEYTALAAYVAQCGFQVEHKLTPRVFLRSALLFDVGFRSLRNTAFEGRSTYSFFANPDQSHVQTSTNKGDAIGLEFALRYRLSRK